MKKFVNISAVIIVLVSITACDFFTTSWGSGFARDNAEKLGEMQMDELALLLSDDEYLSDPDSIASLLAALGQKTPEEIQNLSQADKDSILNLTVSAGVPISSLGDVIETATTGDPGTALTSLINSTGVIDVSATAAVLTDPATLQNSDATTLTAATLTVIVQVAAVETAGAEDQDTAVNDLLTDITNTVADSPANSSPESIVDTMIADGSLSAASREEMIAVATVLQVMTGTSGTGIDRSGDLGGDSLGGFDIGSLL